jgi:serine/threonine protein kinase
MQAKEVFLQAIDIKDHAEREAFVNDMCGEDSGLRRKIQALLAANEDPESFLDQPAARFDVTATAFGKANGSGLSDSSHHGRFLPGTKLADRYRIVSMLGRGGMGEVYRADDLRLGQTVALKFLPRDLAKDPKRLEYFHQEVKLARQISHPNICRVYDIGEVNGQQFLSMEYIDGEDLKTLLHRIGRLPKDKGVQIARQLCSGLAAAHAKGVLHRDLKPANIMIDGQGQVRITDFGLATVSADGENVIGMSGTPAYMAPEQLLRGQTSPRTDIYSLGLILFEVFTGKPAHDANSLPELQRLHEDSSSARNPSDILDDIDPAVERAITRCLSSDPSLRPRTASELAASLPGGDPLAAALAAGETPHPDIVAMSGETKLMSPKVAMSLVAAIVAGLLIHLIGWQKLDKLNAIEPSLSPEVLAYRAQTVLKQLGGSETMVDSSYGFDHEDTQDLNNRIARRPGFANWTRFGFWYRESPNEFRADTLGQDIPRYGNATIDLWYPAWSFAGMRGVRLDNAGLLRWFQAIPPMEKGAAIEAKLPEWSTWFTEEMIGFSLEKLEQTGAKVVPPVVYDQVQAWQGKWPGSDEHLLVVGAAFQGRPVYFEILAEPNHRASEPQPPAKVRTGLTIDAVLKYAVMPCIAIVLMARNVYLRRWDRRGAWRLAVFVVFANLIACLIRAHHSWTDWEVEVLRNCWATALLTGSVTWLNYVALEPTVRRYWPNLLISWTRLLGGRFTDPLIGRDILLGSAIGLGMCVVTLVFPLLDSQFLMLHGKHRLLSIPLTIGSIFFFAQMAVGGVVFATFVMVVMRILIRKQTLTFIVAL